MSVVFGWYSFKIKSFSVKDLKLKEEEWKDSTFEVRQKVFHIFWIPFFSLGKFYVRRKHGKLYDLSNEIREIINLKEKIRTPWYSFLLPILLIAIPIIAGIYIYIAEAIMRYNNFNQDKELYENKIAGVEYQLKNIKPNAYIRLYKSSLGESNRDSIYLLKVIAIQNSVIKYQVKRVNYPENYNEKYFFESISSDTLTTTKTYLKKAICKDYKLLNEYKETGYIFFNKSKYNIISIDYFDEPVLYGGNLDWYFWNLIESPEFQLNWFYLQDSHELSLDFQNFGRTASLVEIKNIENTIEWVDSLPYKFPRYNYIQKIKIKGRIEKADEDFKFKSLFKFKDSLNNKSEFIIQGNKNYFTINKIN
jgi:hypothetical protein